jgi:hypothetical protein
VTVGEHVAGGEEMPSDLLRNAEGQIGIEETGVRLSPLPADIISEDSLAVASVQLINDHMKNSSGTLLLAQVPTHKLKRRQIMRSAYDMSMTR